MAEIQKRFKSSIIIFAVILFSSVVFAEEVTKDPCDTVSLPEPLRQLLAAKFPTWQVLRLSDLGAEPQEAWLNSKRLDQCPGIASGSFETKERLSYALVLIHKEKIISKVLVASRKGKSYQLKVLVDGANYPGRFHAEVVYKIPPGQYHDMYKSESVNLTLDGFQAETIGRTAILFYWKNGRYHELLVMD